MCYTSQEAQLGPESVGGVEGARGCQEQSSRPRRRRRDKFEKSDETKAALGVVAARP